jgi:hypothetical protein
MGGFGRSGDDPSREEGHGGEGRPEEERRGTAREIRGGGGGASDESGCVAASHESTKSPPRRVRSRRPGRFDRSLAQVLEQHTLQYARTTVRRIPRSSARGSGSRSTHLLTLDEYARLRDAAEYAHEEDLRIGLGTRLSIPATPLVEVAGDGSELAALPFAGIPMRGRTAARHLLAVGSTGSGKTYRFAMGLLTSLLVDSDASIVFNNAKGRVTTREIAAVARRLDPDIRVVVFAPADASRSVAINPVAVARRHGMLPRLAAQLSAVVEAGDGGTNFWAAAATRKFKSLLAYPEVDSVVKLAELVGDGELLLEFARAHDDSQLGSMVRFTGSGANGSTSEQNDLACLDGFTATDDVRATTSGPDEVDIVSLVTGADRFLFILEADDSAHAVLGPVIGTVLQLAFDGLARAGRDDRSKSHRHVAFVLDELGSTPIDGLPRKLSIGRTHGYSVWGMVQSLAQIEARYRADARELLAGFNSRLWFLSGLASDDRLALTRSLGPIEVDEFDRHQSPSLDGTWITDSRHARVLERPLLDASDLRMKPHEDDAFGGFAVLDMVDVPPILCHLTPSWRVPIVAEALELGLGQPDVERASPLPRVAERGHFSSEPSLEHVHAADRELLAGEPKRTRSEIEQGISVLRAAVEWPEPPKLASRDRPWIHRFEDTMPRALVLKVMMGLKERRKTAMDLMRALAKARTECAAIGLAQLDLDTLADGVETGPRRAGDRGKW